MKIYGVSQSSGVERHLRVERGIDGVVLTLTDAACRQAAADSFPTPPAPILEAAHAGFSSFGPFSLSPGGYGD